MTSRGNLEEKLIWAFKLYDGDGDGFITREEMYNIVDAIYQMLGSQTKNNNQQTGDEKEEDPKTRVDRIFEQLDKVSTMIDLFFFYPILFCSFRFENYRFDL